MKTILAVVHGGVRVLLLMLGTGQESIASDQLVHMPGVPVEPTLVRVVPSPDEMQTWNAPPSCFRIGRCSAHDLYRFRDRPNRLTRLAPETPQEPPSFHYVWFLVPVTPEENILPKYRIASQIRDEYRAAGTPIDGPN